MIAIGIALCMAPLSASADETPKAIPYPHGKTFVYDGTEKNALGKGLAAVEGGFALPEGVAQVSLVSGHSAAVTQSGDLYTWGRNNYGQIGDGTWVGSRYKPTKISIDSVRYGKLIMKLYEQDPGDTVYATDAGDYHCYAVPGEGYAWDEDDSRDPVEVRWTIRKATYDMSGVTFAGATFTHDGKPHAIEVSGELPAGMTVGSFPAL